MKGGAHPNEQKRKGAKGDQCTAAAVSAALRHGRPAAGAIPPPPMPQVLAQLVAAPRAPADVALVNEAGEPPSVEQLQAQLAALA